MILFISKNKGLNKKVKTFTGYGYAEISTIDPPLAESAANCVKLSALNSSIFTKLKTESNKIMKPNVKITIKIDLTYPFNLPSSINPIPNPAIRKSVMCGRTRYDITKLIKMPNQLILLLKIE